MQIFVHRPEGNVGPYSLQELRHLLDAGVVAEQDLAWFDGLPQWEPVPRLLMEDLRPKPLYHAKQLLGPGPERTRRKYLRHEANLRALSLLYFLAGLFSTVIGLGTAVTFFVSTKHPVGWPVSAALLMSGAFMFWLASQFQKLHRRAVVPGTIVALLGLPVGSLLNVYALYLMHSEGGRVVFSERYQQVMEATPHLKERPSWIARIVLGLLATVSLGLIVDLGVRWLAS
jgi:hypothetical protein